MQLPSGLSLRGPTSLFRGAFLLATFNSILVDAQGNNAQCYFAKNREAGSAIIPCKDPSKYGNTWCCQNGDICLEDYSCWNQQYNITYQYGCTDPDYADRNCPAKGHLDVDKSNWIGLIYCGDVGQVWACHHPDTCSNCPSMSTWLPAIMSLPQEKSGCSDLKTLVAAFAGQTSLQASVWLPAGDDTHTTYFSTDGGSSVSKAGYTPAWVTTELLNEVSTSSTPASTSSASTSDAQPSNGTTNNDGNPTSSGLSTGAKAGIGVGAAAGGLGLLAAAAILFRRKRQEASGSEKPEEPGSGQPMMAASGGGPDGRHDLDAGGYYSPGYKPSSPDPSSSNRLSELPSGYPSVISSPNPSAMGGTPSPAPYSANSPYTPYGAYAQQPQMQQVPEEGVMGYPANNNNNNRPVSELPASRQHEVHELQ